MTEFEQRKRVRDASSRVLHDPSKSKSAIIARNKNPWGVTRKLEYTKKGIRRLKCIRCGEPAEYQWQICSDGNNYRPICAECDIKLNRLVLKFMGHPHAEQVSDEYKYLKG